MKSALVNLLPPEREKQETRGYYLRLTSTVLVFAAFLLLCASVLQGPLLLFQWERMRALNAESNALSGQLSSTSGGEFSNRIKRLEGNISYLSRLATSTSVTENVASLTGLPHTGVQLSGLSYVPGTKNSGNMTISGMASTRTALQRYVDVLGTVPFVKNADLPISAYAKDSDIPFTITVTGTF